METKNNTQKEKIVILIVLILIILIIILFLLINYLGKIDNNEKIPTGNVEIFDIIFGDESLNNNNCNCDCSCHKENNNANTNINGSTICSTCGNYIEKNDNSEIMVYDDEKTYSVSTPLNIFTHTSYQVLNGVIAPESENSYQFVIRNNNHFNIKYSIEAKEENKYNINMKFRLKINGVYVVGNDKQYVTAEELNQYEIKLANHTYDVYTLDWKWFESENDTEVGTNINSNYKLDLRISASQY